MAVSAANTPFATRARWRVYVVGAVSDVPMRVGAGQVEGEGAEIEPSAMGCEEDLLGKRLFLLSDVHSLFSRLFLTE